MIIVGGSLAAAHNAFAISIDPASVYYNDNGNYVPYKLTQDVNTATVATKSGTIVFDRNACSLSVFDSTGAKVLGSDTYSVLASQGNTGIWNPVSVINNAQCNSIIIQSGESISIVGSKSVAGIGIFSINYTKTLSDPLKLTFSATNNNPLWTNYHVGMSERTEVPRFITLGNQTYDLSQHNNTSLNRNWIVNHKSQLIHLTDNALFDMGIGWNNVNDILIQYINNKAYLTIDYTYNTPILQPGNTITIDPSITYDTSATCQTNHATTCSITVGSNSDRVLIANIHYSDNTGSYNATVKKVNLNSGQVFTRLAAGEGHAGAFYADNEIWYLKSPATGAQTVNVTFNALPVHTEIGLVSLYNVDPLTPFALTTKAGGAAIANETISITPTKSGSWLYAVGDSVSNMNSGTFTHIYDHLVDSLGGLYMNAQYRSSPVIGVANHLSWTDTADGSLAYSIIGIEVRNSTHILSTPSLTHANTLNSTAIKLDWNAISNAQWYRINYTSPASGTFSQLVNQSGTSYTATGLTAGTQYAFKVQAGNSTLGGTSFSSYKSNYTSNIAPTSLAASNISSVHARITWTNPTGNFSGFKIEKQPAGSSWGTVVSNTLNTTNHYDLTGLTGGLGYGVRISTNYATGSNYSGISSPSSILNFSTITPTQASLSIGTSVVGDAVQINGTTLVIAGYPTPITLKTTALFVNGTSVQNVTLNHDITVGTNYTYPFWYVFPDQHHASFSIHSVLTNVTGTVTVVSSSNIASRQYEAGYIPARVPTQGDVNYTYVNGSFQVNRASAPNGTYWKIECKYAPWSAVFLNGTDGTWDNHTNIGGYKRTYTPTTREYVSCWNDDLLFSGALVDANSTNYIVPGLVIFDQLGGFLGAPSVLIFILAILSWGTGRNFPMVLVIAVSALGIMGALGLVALHQQIWAIIFVVAGLAIFGIRKFY